MTMQYRIFHTRAGYVGFVATAQGVCRVVLPHPTRQDVERQIRAVSPGALRDDTLRAEVAAALVSYFAGEPTEFDVPLDLSSGTEFDRKVWRACAQVGYGRTASYQDLARRIGRPKGARAVGLAMSRNPAPILIPCHRIVKSDGGLGGYSGPGGVSFKQDLLCMESRAAVAQA